MNERFLQFKNLGLTIKEALTLGKVTNAINRSRRIAQAGGNTNQLDQTIVTEVNEPVYKAAVDKLHKGQKVVEEVEY